MRRTAAYLLMTVALAACSGPPATERPQAVPVYYVGEREKLFREFHRLTTADPASAAVREMLAAPIDPDYRSYWPKGISLRSPVTADGGVITVDLTGAGAIDLGAKLTVQQLVYTVQGALQSTDPVRVLVDGKPVTAEPVARGDIYALRSYVQIDAPAHGATVGRQFEVSGEAAVFEGTVHWEVRRGDAVLRSGVTNSAGGMLTFGAYRFGLDLEPGEYTLRVIADDPSDGQSGPPASDDKTITVTA